MPALLLLALFFLVPVMLVLVRSVMEPEPGLGNYAELLGSSAYRGILVNTFVVSAVVTAVTLLLGFPLAWLLALLPRGWSLVVLGIVLISMWTNLLARSFAWLVLLQQTGVTIGMSYIMLPYLVMPLLATIQSLDPAVFRASALCGANRWQVFWRVFLPSCMPGIAAGCLMVFVMSLGYFITPAILGGSSSMMGGQLIAQLIQSLLNWGLGGAAAVILIVVTLAIYALQLRLVDPFKAAGGRH